MAQLKLEPPVYQIGEYAYSKTSGVISKNNQLVRLRAKESSLLNTLIEQFPSILTREDIVHSLYKDTYATDATINQLVKRLRKALDDNQRSLIRTIPKQGYMLTVAPRPLEVKNIEPIVHPKYIASSHFMDAPNNIDIRELNSVVAATSSVNEATKQRLFGAASVVGGIMTFLIGWSLSIVMSAPNYHLDAIDGHQLEMKLKSKLEEPFVVREAIDNELTLYFPRESGIVVCQFKEELTSCK